MSIKLANKFLEKNKVNQRILQKIDEIEEYDEEYELVSKTKNRRISSIFKIKERRMSQMTVDCTTTMVICFAGFVYGLITTESQIQYSNNSLIRLIWSLSQAFGSLVIAVFLNLFGRPKTCAVSMFMLGITELLPFGRSDNAWLPIVISSTKGFTSGAIFTSLIVWVIAIWRDRSLPMIQTLFFLISLSDIIVKLIHTFDHQVIDQRDYICRANQDQNSSTILFQSWCQKNDNIQESQTNITQTNVGIPRQDISHVLTVCQSFLAFCSTSLFVIIYDNFKHYKKRINRLVFKTKRTKSIFKRMFISRSSKDMTNTWKEYCFIIITSIFLLSSVISIQFVNIKLLSYISRPETKSILLTLNLLKTLFSGISIFIGRLVQPKILLIVSLIITESVNIVLILFGTNSYTIAVIVTVGMAVGFSPAIASVYALIERSLIINHNIGALVVFCSGLMSVINTEITQRLIDDKNSFFYICMSFVSMTSAVIMLSLILFSKIVINNCDGFNVRPVSLKMASKEYTFESESELRFDDNYGSDGTYKLRDTSIVSI